MSFELDKVWIRKLKYSLLMFPVLHLASTELSNHEKGTGTFVFKSMFYFNLISEQEKKNTKSLWHFFNYFKKVTVFFFIHRWWKGTESNPKPWSELEIIVFSPSSALTPTSTSVLASRRWADPEAWLTNKKNISYYNKEKYQSLTVP